MNTDLTEIYEVIDNVIAKVIDNVITKEHLEADIEDIKAQIVKYLNNKIELIKPILCDCCGDDFIPKIDSDWGKQFINECATCNSKYHYYCIHYDRANICTCYFRQ